MPNSKEVPPESLDEERNPLNPSNNGNNNSANNMDPEVVGVGQPVAGVAGMVRRDENSISFRHFLQPHSDVVPAPAPTCRRSRGTQPGAVDLVDMAMALPDFVQDHLVVESLAIADLQNDGGANHSTTSSLDLNVLNEILPDFTTSQSAHSLPSQACNSRRRNIPEDAPVPMDVPHGAPGTSALPDFLSDGPMQCTDSNVVDNTTQASSSRAASRLVSSTSLTDRSRIVDESARGSSFDASDTLRSEVDRLRREVMERNRRISQLESEVLRLRSNISTLESALRNAEQTAVVSEARLMQVQRRSENLGSSASGGGANGGGDASDSASSRDINSSGVVEPAEIDAHIIRDIALSSESLISQLLHNMSRLQRLVPSNHSSEENQEKSNTTGDGNPD